jgi:hypothetical protein
MEKDPGMVGKIERSRDRWKDQGCRDAGIDGERSRDRWKDERCWDGNTREIVIYMKVLTLQ